MKRTSSSLKAFQGSQYLPPTIGGLRSCFGGDLMKGHAKSQRPIDPKKSLHLVLRSTQARGEKSFLSRNFRAKIHGIVHDQAERFSIKIYEFANVGNHLHMLIRPQDAKLYRKFIRAVTGLIARLVLKRQRGVALALQTDTPPAKKSFWDKRPFSRIVSWGKDFENLCNYVMKNKIEAVGFDRKTAKLIASRIKSSLEEDPNTVLII